MKTRIGQREARVAVAILTGAAVLVLAVATLCNIAVVRGGQAHTVSSAQHAPSSQAAIVLGARVFDGDLLSHVLADRLDTGIELYRAGKVEKLLLTGDHGRFEYDEVNAMRRYVVSRGVPPKDVFMDHAGFDTYDSMYRARDVFGVKRAIVVTQRFHLARSVYTARSLGIDASGVPADKHVYMKASAFETREALARIKAFVELNLTHPEPRYLGKKIPITGDGRATND